MLYNYFKIAWRNLTKHKVFSFINIFGLASGMTVCMLAMIKIKEAYDYDTFHPNSTRTYRIITRLEKKSGEHLLCASTPLPLAPYLKENYKAIDKSLRVYFSSLAVTIDDKKFTAKEAFVDADFYKVFGFTLSSGSAATAPQTAVLTSETATRFFGKEDPVGRTVIIGDSVSFVVTGVLARSPFPSHLKFDLLAAVTSIPFIHGKDVLADWGNEAAGYTYVQLQPKSAGGDLQRILQDVSKKANSIVLPGGKKLFFDIQPFDKISPGTLPLYNITAEPIFPNLLVFGLIGFSMLLLAFFNYINLTLSRSLDRAKEVGIRKVAGARRSHLVFQFLTESVLVAIFAFALAYLQLEWMNELATVRRILGDAAQDKTLWIYFAIFTLMTGMLAGWIPARVLSAFQPVRVLKGRFNIRLFGGVPLRKTLTVVQFATSLIAIVTLIVFYRQSYFMASADYGFTRQQILNVTISGQEYEKVANAFSTVPGVEQVAATSGLFGFSAFDNRFIRREKTGDSLPAAYFSVTPSFLENMGIQLIAGKTLPATGHKESRMALINEEAARVLGFHHPADAAGKLIWTNDTSHYIVSGVVKDFHYASFLRRIGPLVLMSRPDEFRVISLRVTRGTEKTVVPVLANRWKQLYPNQAFEAGWFDKQLYNQHLHIDDLSFLAVLTIMAVTIACLGLLGMVIYTTKNRCKEISIRRVLGAAIGQVMLEVSKEFLFLLMWSVLIGLPVGFFVARQFLQQYAYRVPVDSVILAGCAGGLLMLGSLTIAWHTYRAALSNPAARLRSQ